MNRGGTLLEMTDLHVAYGKVEALRGVALQLAEGSIATVIGPNGAGKTTLLASLMGLLPHQGALRYRGESLDGVAVEQRVSRGMSLVPERRELFGEMDVQDNLRLGAFQRYRRRDPAIAEDLDRVYETFPRLKERATQLANTLSGGERQMLALGRALMARPKLLMLDEPSLGLAPLVVREIFHVIERLCATGVSILLVEMRAPRCRSPIMGMY
jgi:branched-chain amino acid transport system ATP-binding protein